MHNPAGNRGKEAALKQNRRNYKELACREKIFDLVTTNIDDVFLVYNHLEMKGEYVSDNCERVLGIPARALEQDISLFRSRLMKESLSALDEVLGSGPLKETAECDLKFRQSTRLLDIKLRLYPVYVDEQLIQYIAVISDQTRIVAQQKALNEALISAQKANEAKRSFLSRMSHEIRTPMNAIIGMTAIAMKHMNDEERVGDCLSKIAYSSKHLLSLINDVLDMSKIDDGKLLVNNQRFNLQKLVESITSIVYAQAKENNLNFKILVTDLTDEYLIGDELRINQVLLNLLSNAIKFTPAGGDVTLEISQLRKKNDRISIRFIVRDTGIGMSDEFMERLYTPFEQADGSISQRFGGTGLGMSITKNLVAIMDGSIAVESEEGKGTTFIVDIPFGVTEQNRVTNYSELDHLKVIVVDNDQDTCEHAVLLLDQMGVTAHWAYSGMEAVEKVVQAHRQGAEYDVCFIDWCMPDMDGVETTRRIRQEIGPDTLIIIISAYDWGMIEKEAREAGVNAFVSKPFFASTLYNTLISVAAAPAAVPVQNDVSYNFSGKKILLAEDNVINQEIALAILRETGVEVDTAEDGRKAVDCYEQSAPGEYALILMDIQMPYMDGYEATRLIRDSSHADAGTIPIFAMTANAFNEDVAASREAGMNGHLSKPIDVQTLYRTIAPYLN